MKIKKGDTVKVLLGKDKGRTGKVQKILRKKDKLVIEGINLYKKHVKPQGEGKPGGIVEMPRPLSVSKVVLICPVCSKTTRIGYQVGKAKGKQRVCKKCEAII